MDKQTWFNLLYDYYGTLLTAKQQQIMQLYFGEDLSLAEIAEQVGISRQGVYDQVRKAGKMLESYEARLGFLQAEQQQQQVLKEVAAFLQESRQQLQQGIAEGVFSKAAGRQLTLQLTQTAERLAELRNFPEV